MKLIPLGDKLVIKQVEAEASTKSGILLTSQAKERPQIATVVAVGPGGNVDGRQVEMTVKPGDKIIYSRFAGSEFKVDGTVLTVIRLSDVMAIVEE